jgi:hypothetical protein
MCFRLALLVAAAAILLPLAGTSLEAATLEDIQGEVLVDRGGGFDIVSGPTTLSPGNTVIANPGSQAQIVYDSTCKVPVVPGAVVAVHNQSPCNGGGESQGGSMSATTLLVGGAVVGLGAAAAVLLTSGGDDKPASP